MSRRSFISSSISCTLLVLLCCILPSVHAFPSRSNALSPRDYDKVEIKVDKKKHDLQFFNFVTRPDIDAPRWDIKVYDEDALAPGYWFVAPYGIVEQKSHDKPYVGPHIYDNSGDLIWSGAPLLDNYAVFDFKVSNVRGNDMLTMINQHANEVAIVDNNYNVNQTIRLGGSGPKSGKLVNIHDFQVVNNGTRALVFNRDRKNVTREKMATAGYHSSCTVEYPGFVETDLETGKVLFQWSPENHIALNETYMDTHDGCGGDGWDYVHSNSIEKLSDGDFLMSSRRAYTLYKISHTDGSIIWRLGGKNSNFKWIGEVGEGHFLGQHDARVLSQNETHMMITMMDNAMGPGHPSKNNDCSRGLTVALRTDTNPMTAQFVSSYNHPHGGFASGRGNFQTLPNGNGFLGWTDKSLQSEHSPEGKVVMEASIPSGLKSYRNYKFNWVGLPQTPPDVHSAAVSTGERVATIVHVSWNGATEVASWNLYKTNARGDADASELLVSKARSGFETTLMSFGYATYVIVEAVDSAGKAIGASRVVKTISPSDQLSQDVIEEAQWLQSHSKIDTAGYANPPQGSSDWAETLNNPIVAFFSGIVFCLAALLSGWALWRARWANAISFPWRRGQQAYDPLFDSEESVENEEWERNEKTAIPSVVVMRCDE